MSYYTYTHATPDGKVFYVGKGKGPRAYATSGRPIAWKEMVAQHDGISIKIVARFETEAEALAHEEKLIKHYLDSGLALVNLAMGGKGPRGYCQSEELRAHKRRLMTGYKYKIITCPKCGTTGGETSLKRWHFDKCRGIRKCKARATVNGKRVFLGNYGTKEEAAMVVKRFLDGARS